MAANHSYIVHIGLRADNIFLNLLKRLQIPNALLPDRLLPVKIIYEIYLFFVFTPFHEIFPEEIKNVLEEMSFTSRLERVEFSEKIKETDEKGLNFRNIFLIGTANIFKLSLKTNLGR